VLQLTLSAFSLILTCSLAGLVTLRAIERGRVSEPPGRARALVVLGAAVRQGRPCPELLARLDRTAQLWRCGAAPVVVCSGSRAEATAMRRALERAGLPAAAVEEDPSGVSTRATVTAAHGRRSVILVSSPWHAHRLRAEVKRQRLAARVCVAARSPVESSPGARRRQLEREIAASWAYALSGRLTRRRPARRPPAPSEAGEALVARGEV
jgi:uncharacterized SAM-binding protein YcdF (DUF218 family)